MRPRRVVVIELQGWDYALVLGVLAVIAFFVARAPAPAPRARLAAVETPGDGMSAIWRDAMKGEGRELPATKGELRWDDPPPKPAPPPAPPAPPADDEEPRPDWAQPPSGPPPGTSSFPTPLPTPPERPRITPMRDLLNVQGQSDYTSAFLANAPDVKKR